MRRVKLVVAYDGTNYHGWQIQPRANTIEEELNKHLSELLKEDIKVIGASRTDSGVHALGNIAVFDTNTNIAPEKIRNALNKRLPEDIMIQSSEQVDDNYHPRRMRVIKTYIYRILNAKTPNPLARLYSHFTYVTLDVEKMQEAAGYFLGEHDFKSFCSSHTKADSTVRTITAIEIEKHEDMIEITVSGNRFLYNMVRIIVGTLIQVGQGKYPPHQIEAMIQGKNRKLAGPTAPANGLTLIGQK